ncbi:Ubiquinone Biosynthesis Monooxygenase Coq6 [Manis pentadactyla]|nr:Ubiquinone Biosynthesis Monooxygenase Coq6 [Manis pentadactyla]
MGLGLRLWLWLGVDEELGFGFRLRISMRAMGEGDSEGRSSVEGRELGFGFGLGFSVGEVQVTMGDEVMFWVGVRTFVMAEGEYVGESEYDGERLDVGEGEYDVCMFVLSLGFQLQLRMGEVKCGRSFRLGIGLRVWLQLDVGDGEGFGLWLVVGDDGKGFGLWLGVGEGYHQGMGEHEGESAGLA